MEQKKSEISPKIPSTFDCLSSKWKTTIFNIKKKPVISPEGEKLNGS